MNFLPPELTVCCAVSLQALYGADYTEVVGTIENLVQQIDDQRLAQLIDKEMALLTAILQQREDCKMAFGRVPKRLSVKQAFS
jgi:hypothetical protein